MQRELVSSASTTIPSLAMASATKVGSRTSGSPSRYWAIARCISGQIDGWWSEGYNGQNGWAIDGTTLDDPAAQDERDATALYDLLEHEVRPTFFARDANGIPVAWIAMIRASLRSLAPTYSTARMLADYRERIYSPTR